jgi:hypothetical protein
MSIQARKMKDEFSEGVKLSVSIIMEFAKLKNNFKLPLIRLRVTQSD